MSVNATTLASYPQFVCGQLDSLWITHSHRLTGGTR